EAFKTQYHSDLFGDDYEALIADGRYKYITKYFSPTLKRKNEDKFIVTSSDKVDKVLTNKVWGIPIFLLVFFAIFHLTFSENILFLGSVFNGHVSFEGTAFEGLFIGESGLNSIGVILTNLVNILTGLITDGVRQLLSTSPTWITGLVCDGVLGGIFSILGFLPQILLLFLFFSILEDSGYMARIAFILDRPLRKFGLTGRAFLPLIMGFGCSVPAIINTRTLSDEKEKNATVRVIPFFSCGAKLPILTAISGVIISSGVKGSADLITYSMYLLGVITALISVLIMRNTTLKGELPPFIMELPSYHIPQFKNLMVLLWDKAKHFITKAFTIILASTIVIWFVCHFSFSWNFLTDEQINQSILASVGKFIQPIFTPLGFGYNNEAMREYGWVFVVAAITGLVAKENVVATLGSLATCLTLISNATIADMIAITSASTPVLLSFIMFNMTTIPCMAAVSASRGEMPNKKTFKLTILFWVITSFIVASTVYVIGSWWWTSFIYVAVAVGVFFAIRSYSKKIDKKQMQERLNANY
ncbi:MAG: ferrous iron transporter B, partial [Clostridia bacterium]|nr:ferrous iron transporter B [Clostridia bacterium]